MKKIFFLISLILILIQAGNLYSATEFVCSIQESGGDYNCLSDWENAIGCDLTKKYKDAFIVRVDSCEPGDYNSYGRRT